MESLSEFQKREILFWIPESEVNKLNETEYSAYFDTHMVTQFMQGNQCPPGWVDYQAVENRPQNNPKSLTQHQKKSHPSDRTKIIGQALSTEFIDKKTPQLIILHSHGLSHIKTETKQTYIIVNQVKIHLL